MSACAHCGQETRCSCDTHTCCPDCHWTLHEEPHRMRVELAPVPWDVRREALALDEVKS